VLADLEREMSVFLRGIEFLGLSIWLGSDVFLSFVVAPGAFSVLASRDQAGAIVGYSLGRMHWMGIICGAVILLVRVLRIRSLTALVAPAALYAVLMIILTVISQVTVSPKMAVLRVRMGSIEATAAGNPLLAEFARLHTISVGLESGVLLAGMATLFWMVKDAVR
jgi:uncharacterized membrane protein